MLRLVLQHLLLLRSQEIVDFRISLVHRNESRIGRQVSAACRSCHSVDLGVLRRLLHHAALVEVTGVLLVLLMCRVEV